MITRLQERFYLMCLTISAERFWMFIACFYIKGKSKRTDWLVKNILSKKGWFTPPYPTEKQLIKILEKMYSRVEFHVDGSMVYFKSVK